MDQGQVVELVGDLNDNEWLSILEVRISIYVRSAFSFVFFVHLFFSAEPVFFLIGVAASTTEQYLKTPLQKGR